MKQLTIWVCDFCDMSSQDIKYMKEHEPNCKYNPIHQKCMSCCHYYEPSFNKGAYACKLNHNSYAVIRDITQCKDWETNNLNLLRNLKLERLKLLDNKKKENGKRWI